LVAVGKELPLAGMLPGRGSPRKIISGFRPVSLIRLAHRNPLAIRGSLSDTAEHRGRAGAGWKG
jgi:hypothetical protein